MVLTLQHILETKPFSINWLNPPHIGKTLFISIFKHFVCVLSQNSCNRQNDRIPDYQTIVTLVAHAPRVNNMMSWYIISALSLACNHGSLPQVGRENSQLKLLYIHKCSLIVARIPYTCQCMLIHKIHLRNTIGARSESKVNSHCPVLAAKYIRNSEQCTHVHSFCKHKIICVSEDNKITSSGELHLQFIQVTSSTCWVHL